MSATPPQRVAIIGSHGVGKTTLLGLLAAALPGVPALPETAREVIADFGLPPQDMDDARREEFQREILRRQIARESFPGPFLTDRCVLDTLAYAHGMECYGELRAQAVRHLASRPYTCVLLVPKRFAPEPDGVRMVDERFQEEVERRLRALLAELGVPFHEIRADTPQGRTLEALAIIGT